MLLETSISASADHRAEDRRRSRRRERHAARAVLWQITDQRRMAYCGRFPSTDVGVVVKASGSVADGTRRAGLGGLQSCGSVWACPVCSEKIQAERQAEVSAALNRWMSQQGREVVFLTLTMRHHKGHSLKALWEALSYAWARTTSSAGRHWKDDKEVFGIAHYLRVVEVTHGVNGWHVHVHCLLLLDRRTPITDTEMWMLRERLFGRWEKALAKKNLTVWERVGIDLRRVRPGDELADYFTKTTYRETSAEGAAFEVAGTSAKKAGKGRTPFQILADLVSPPDDADHDTNVALWREWEKVSKGRRQLIWSRGLRDEMGLNDERTDEEIVAEDTGGDVLEYLHQEWYACHLAGRATQLLEAAEADDTGEVLAAYLNRIGRELRERQRE